MALDTRKDFIKSSTISIRNIFIEQANDKHHNGVFIQPNKAVVERMLLLMNREFISMVF